VAKQGVVSIHGREYKTVALRVNEFRQQHSIEDGWGIIDIELDAPEGYVKVQAFISHPDGTHVASGLAEEERGTTQINKTSALENCATSAIGRALAAAGYGGTEFASANEVQNAIAQQKEKPVDETPDRIQPIDDKKQSIDDIPDDIADTVSKNIAIGRERMGDEKYKTWHGRVLSNYFQTDSINGLDKAGLARFAGMQSEMLKLSRGD
jgi:hypothetical protein